MIPNSSAYPGHPLALFPPLFWCFWLRPFLFLSLSYASSASLLPVHAPRRDRAIASNSFIVLIHHYLHRDNVNGQGRAIANPTAVAGGSANVSIESCTTACFNAGFGIAGTEFAAYVFQFFFSRYTQRSLTLYFPFCTSLLYWISFPTFNHKILLAWRYSECCK